MFQLKIISCGLKIVGKPHIQAMLDACTQKVKNSELISGFDMVNEEDYNPGCDEFLAQMYEAKAKLGGDLNFYLHSGESNSRENTELYDSILLGTKRIGHGFNLTLHPKLLQMVKDQNICIECCPVSNRILGYTNDLRIHPARALLANGVKVSISPDDQGFFDARGTTLDFVLVFLAWKLTLADLKQLCLNSIEFASISQEEKDKLTVFFDYKWRRFLAYVRGRY